MSNNPLAGQRVVVTRSSEQTAVFCEQLRVYGAEPISFPVIQFLPLVVAPFQLEKYDWLIFTSSNGVRFFWQQLTTDQHAQLSQLKIAVSGSATAAWLRQHGIEPTFIPDEFVGEKLVTGLGAIKEQHILLPRAKIGRPKISQLLRQQGALVDDIPLYDTVTAVPSAKAWAELEQGYDVITFTSPSSVRNFLKLIAKKPTMRTMMQTTIIACIGPITSKTAVQNGLIVHIMPPTYTIEALAAAMADYFAKNDSLKMKR